MSSLHFRFNVKTNRFAALYFDYFSVKIMFKKYITGFESAKLSQVGALLTDCDGAGRYRLVNQKVSSTKNFRSTLINLYFSLLYKVEYR